MHAIEASRGAGDPPEWARLQRALIDRLGDAIDPIVSEYLDDGEPRWPPEGHVGIDGHDDLYEGFYNWPLAYAVGGDESLLVEAKRAFEGIVERCSAVETPFGHPMAVGEYEQCRDWFHQGEANLLLYNLGLADPGDERFRERAERFAGFYLPGSPTGNYDGERRVVRAPQTGSMGPEFCDFSAFVHHPYGHDYGWRRHGSAFHDIGGLDSIGDITDPDSEDRLFEALQRRCSAGDVPLNLSVTSLMTHAYLHTGDERYCEWVTEYVDAWADRTREDGIVPDNVGPSGAPGGVTGDWYGGFYGWSWGGYHYVGIGPTVGAENARLLGADRLDLPRELLDALMERGIEVPAGPTEETLYLPHKYGADGDYHYADADSLREDDGAVRREDGWYEFHPLEDTPYPTHLWYASMEPADRDRLRALRDYESRDFRRVDPRPPGKHGQHDRAWLAYLDGDFPGYPARVLEATHAQVDDRLAVLAEEGGPPEDIDEDYLRDRNPVSEEALLQLTMGAPAQIYYGGLLQARVRHLDPGRERPGLPPDVAALVSGLDADSVTLTLVNAGDDARAVVVQAGAYGEHTFGAVRHDGEVTAVEDTRLRVELPGRTRVTLDADVARFDNDPSYDLPF
ncbi:MAG: hypothetical protein ABEH77_05590 [Halobacteriaceae archaeon]